MDGNANRLYLSELIDSTIQNITNSFSKVQFQYLRRKCTCMSQCIRLKFIYHYKISPTLLYVTLNSCYIRSVQVTLEIKTVYPT